MGTPAIYTRVSHYRHRFWIKWSNRIHLNVEPYQSSVTVWQYCQYILHVEWNLFENVQNVKAVRWICLDVIIWAEKKIFWACRALTVYFAGWNSCFENWNWNFYDIFLIEIKKFIIRFWYSNFSKPFVNMLWFHHDII